MPRLLRRSEESFRRPFPVFIVGAGRADCSSGMSELSELSDQRSATGSGKDWLGARGGTSWKAASRAAI